MNAYNRRCAIVAPALVAMLSGCGATTEMLDNQVVDPAQARTVMASSAQATKRSQLDQVDLTALLREKTQILGCVHPNEVPPPPVVGAEQQDNDTREFYFYLSRFDACVADTTAARNQIQDLILAV